jgi:hypothetical protein
VKPAAPKETTVINKNDPTAEPEKAYFVLDNLAPPRTAQYPLAKNTHDFRDPVSGSIQTFDFIHGEAREVPLFVAQRCEEENAKVPQGHAKPFHISYGDPSAKPFDSADPSVLTLAEVVASIRVKAPKEAGVLMEKLEDAITVAIDRHTKQSKAMIEDLGERLEEAELARQKAEAGTSMQLLPDEVVAGLHELHRDALVVRAQTYPEGGKFNGGSKKEDVIDFLVEKAKGAAPAVPTSPPGAVDPLAVA